MVRISKRRALRREERVTRRAEPRSPFGTVEPPPLAAITATPRPITLTGEARRAYVSSAILAFEGSGLAQPPRELKRKLDKLTESPFVFFRGTADLFYRDIEGMDAGRAVVLLNADAHPENLGVLRSPAKELFYGLDDLDESHPGPFAWDLRRSLTGLELVARERAFDAEARREVLSRFITGYREALHRPRKLADGPRFVEGSSPKMVAALLKKAAEGKRSEFLAELVDLETATFRSSPEVVRLPERIPEIERALEPYRRSLRDRANITGRYHRVKDFAEKKGSGTGSIGLRRFYVLIEGKSKNAKNDILLELKGRRPSVLTSHVRFSASRLRAMGDFEARILAQWASGDRFSGIVSFEGTSYKVRERHPHHGRVDLERLSAPELADYAAVIGALVADGHTSGGIGPGGRSPKAIARELRLAMTPRFAEELIVFASEAADRVVADHAAFSEHHAQGLTSSRAAQPAETTS